VLDALRQARPEFYEGIEDVDHEGTRPFSSLAELASSASWLGRIELQQRLFEDHFEAPLPEPATLALDGCQPSRVEDLSLTALFLTGLANQLLEGVFSYQPIAVSRLTELHQRVTLDGKLNPQLRDEVCAWAEALEAGGGGFVDWCLASWDDEFCNQAPEEVDVRYMEGPIWRL